ncbi:MAG TPA: hypothetical protein VGQ70_03005, partial [Candidatus Udaeobacter sp.]|nr:hypothetical protein [Candidatus Udaeobacter sp.]
MKKQINPSIKAHLLWSTLILLSLLAIRAIPFALAQRHVTEQSVTQSAAKPSAPANMYLPKPATPAALAAPAAHIPAGAPASAFGLSVKVANAPFGHHTGVGRDASVVGNNPLLTYVIDDGTAESA